MTDRTDDLAELLRHASRALRRSTMALVEPFGLSVHQFHALRFIAGRGGGETRCAAPDASPRISDIAGRMGMVTRSATDVVDHLERKGFVRRAQHPTDRRSRVVEATGHGLDVLAKVESGRVAHAEEFFGRLDPSEQDALAVLLRRLI
ncbi:MarR family winged helix-turn-helix transcriptional regulator [Cumulibacter soli]|uniref:MarR family winged helix-turn-helix transcriptional regulator n=1 Tax=Cumulibacter soli TaxID=2546344 RepID=UPI001419696B|nr:MarR family transcriptional regulator [Cumulibacter soli]